MAIEFIKSSDIEVFPAVHRATEYGISKKTTEENLIKFGKLSSNKANLSQMFEDPDDSLYVIFNIAGYWFRCLETKIPSGDNLYAYIALKKDPIIGYILTPTDSLTVGGVLDGIVGADTDKSFKGLAFTEDAVPNNSGGIVYYGLQIRDSDGDLIHQNLKLDASEIRNTAGDDATKAISQEFDTGTLTAETINGLTIDQTTGTLTITNDKTVNAYVDLDVGASETNTGKVTIRSAGSSPTIITGPNNGSTVLLDGEMVEKDTAQTLKNKTFVAPILEAATATSINGLKISSSTGTLTIADTKTLTASDTTTLANSTITLGNGKVLTFSDDTALATNTITLGSGKALTMQYAGLTVGDSSGTGTITVKSNNSADRILTLSGSPTLAGNNSLTLTHASLVVGDSDGTGTVNIKTNNTTGRSLTLTGSPSLSAITTTGGGKLALNKDLTINDANKIFAGAGTSLTIDNSLDIAGTTGQITLGTNPYTLAFTTTNNTGVTLPTTGTLATLNEKETLTQKTLTSPILTTPKINDSDARYTYNIAVSELAADRTITLPLLTGNDEFVFKDFTQTLKNKTLTSPTINTSDINGGTVDSLTSLSIRDTSAAFDVTIAGTSSTALTAGRKLTLDIVNADKTIKLTGSPSLSGITTTGTGTLALNKNLTVAADVSINAPLTITAGSTVSIDADVGILGPVYVSDDGVSLLSDVTVNSALQVGKKSSYPNAGKVTIQSAGQQQTTITGPNDGEAKLIAGTYGSLATTDTTPPVSAMRMLISTGPNSAVWAVDVINSGFKFNGSSYHSTIDIPVVHSTPINGFYRKKYSDSAFNFKRLFRDTGLRDLSKCFAVTSLTFEVPYSTASDATSGTTKIVVPFTLGTASSAQTTNYTAVANDSGSTPGVASKIEISADGICTIYVAVVKTDISSFRVDNLDFTGSVIQITE